MPSGTEKQDAAGDPGRASETGWERAWGSAGVVVGCAGRAGDWMGERVARMPGWAEEKGGEDQGGWGGVGLGLGLRGAEGEPYGDRSPAESRTR